MLLIISYAIRYCSGTNLTKTNQNALMNFNDQFSLDQSMEILEHQTNKTFSLRIN